MSSAAKSNVTVRRVTQADEDVWRKLWEQYNVFYKRTIPDNVTRTTFKRFLDDSVRMYGAVAETDDKKVVGFVTWYPHANTSSIEEVVYLNDLFVDPATRNSGAGRKLIEHVYEHASSIPAAQVYWLTQYFNHRAQLLYTNIATKSDYVHYFKNLNGVEYEV